MSRTTHRVYLGLFNGWDGVLSEFQVEIPESAHERIRRGVGEPRFLFAAYEYEDYNGQALVLWSRDGHSFSMVKGGHCSCYGLEDQWEPEEIPVETLRHLIRNGDDYTLGWDTELVDAWLDVVEGAASGDVVGGDGVAA